MKSLSSSSAVAAATSNWPSSSGAGKGFAGASSMAVPQQLPLSSALIQSEFNKEPLAWSLQSLAELGFSCYGDMPAHNLLHRECNKTAANVAARLAAIPLVQVLKDAKCFVLRNMYKSIFQLLRGIWECCVLSWENCD